MGAERGKAAGQEPPQHDGAAPHTRPGLVAVVVTHNRARKLDVTLARLFAVPEGVLAAVVIVDNLSTDATARVIAGHAAAAGGRLLVHHSAVNLGGAGGFALGLRMAVEAHDPDWIVVMDDDARPDPGALAVFRGHDYTGWDAVGAAVYFPGGEICEMNRPSRNPFWSWQGFSRLVRHLFTGQGRDGFHIPRAHYVETAPVPVDASSFVGLFLSRGAIRRAGYPDARLFIYGDDVLYTLGLRAKGGRICFDPRVRFEHDFTTIHAAEKRFQPLWRSYYHHRNLLLVYRRAAGPLFWPSLLIVLPKWLLKVRHHRGERRAYLRLLGMAVGDGLRGRLDVSLADVQRAAQSEKG